MIAKKESADIVYFVEDDYLHSEDAITEMIFAYEKFNNFSKDLVLLPSDYPYLYAKDEATKFI